MEGPARELREHAVGKTLLAVRTTPEGWMCLVFADTGSVTPGIEWWISLDAARSIEAKE